jgi:hypothetical protein
MLRSFLPGLGLSTAVVVAALVTYVLLEEMLGRLAQDRRLHGTERWTGFES